MNEKKAKALRRKVYGDTSLKINRHYVHLKGHRTVFNHPKSKRAVYQYLKRAS